jgi:flagellar hook protein FlgE
MTRAAYLTVATAWLATACTIEHGGQGASGDYLSEAIAEPPGEDCEYGGERLRLGVDENENGELDAAEVYASGVACRLPAEADDEPEPQEPVESECLLVGGGDAVREATSGVADLALAGEGFFVLEGDDSATLRYTRAGSFHLGDAACLLNAQDLRLRGYDLEGALVDLCLEALTLPAIATNRASIAANLDSNSPIRGAWDPSSPALTSNFSTPVVVIDRAGEGHMLTLFFARATTTTWSWHALLDAGEVEGGSPGELYEGAAGVLLFTPDGALSEDTTEFSRWPFVAAGPHAIAFDFGTSVRGDSGTGLDGTTQFASPSSVSSIEADGYAAGSLSALEVDETSLITAVYSNDQRRPVGRPAVALFTSTDGLACKGPELWEATDQTGEPLLGSAGEVGRGRIVAGQLERPVVE